jgi:hypothetical protein
MANVLDFTQRDISGAEVLAAGAVGCCRYILNAPIAGANDKECRADEVAEKSAAGCRLAANFEWGERPTDDIATGQRHAGLFLGWCDAVGAPDWAPCYFSQDANNPAGAYHTYFTGVVREIGLSRSGVYGNGAMYRSLLSAGLVSWAWQSKSSGYAGNSTTTGANLVQQLATKAVGGHQVDVNHTQTALWGGWLLGEVDPMAGIDSTDVATILHTDGIIPNPGYRADSPSHTPPGTNAFVAWQTIATEAAAHAYYAHQDVLAAIAKIDALAKQVAELSAAGGASPGIDYAALAKAVNDDAATRRQDWH